jgi:hypothetical protein
MAHIAAEMADGRADHAVLPPEMAVVCRADCRADLPATLEVHAQRLGSAKITTRRVDLRCRVDFPRANLLQFIHGRVWQRGGGDEFAH